MKARLAVRHARTESDLRRCFPALAELRPHVRETEFVGRIRRQQAAGYHLVFLAPPRFLNLPKARTRVLVRAVSATAYDLTFRTSAFQHRFAFDLPGQAHRGSDNYFELYPDEPRTVRVVLDQPTTAATLRKTLVHQSLVDSY